VSSSTSARPSLGRDLPRTDDVRHPPRHLLHNPVLRMLARRLIARRWDLHVTGGEHLPAHGPVIVAANHIGWLDGPLLGIVLPRPVHALTKLDMFTGRTGAFLQRTGQIPVDRFHADPRAVKTALRVLRDGDVVGVFPEGTRGDGELRRIHRGAAYFALASGAPVVPVTFLGTRLPGGDTDSRPPTGSRIDVVVGPPVEVTRQTWPRKREQVDDLSRLLHRRLRESLDAARAATGRDLPGPLPADQREPDPATAINDEPTGPSSTEEHHD
jgi:1-acyl-sn-glycerol-3-phosphate acyltransferase